MVRRAAVCLALLLAGCSSSTPPASAPMIAPVMVSLVESEPVETSLDRPDILDAYDVWLEMFRNAKRSIDIAQFYASEAEEKWIGTSKLTAILQALGDAHKRGVKVRFLVDEKFVPQYPGTMELLEKSGFDVRRIKGDALFGGVQHAKYFVVDGFTTFIGSQNFDWRAIDHIQEMGVRLYSHEIATQLREVFETDWELAGGAPPSTRVQLGTPPGNFPGIEARRVKLVASPQAWLPDEASWDLPQIIGLIDAAKRSVKVQVLKYKTANRDGSRFADLDDALRRATTRGVNVQLLVSEWALKDKSLEALQQLTDVADVRVIKIPAFSGGEIPFARVAHAKYMVVDGNAAWIGTSNWEGDYFTKSRNVGVILQDGEVPTRLARFFDENWVGAYVSKIPVRAPEVPAAQ